MKLQHQDWTKASTEYVWTGDKMKNRTSVLTRCIFRKHCFSVTASYGAIHTVFSRVSSSHGKALPPEAPSHSPPELHIETDWLRWPLQPQDLPRCDVHWHLTNLFKVHLFHRISCFHTWSDLLTSNIFPINVASFSWLLDMLLQRWIFNRGTAVDEPKNRFMAAFFIAGLL